MTTVTLLGEDSSLASQCLAFCQALASQGKALSFSLKIDSTFSFNLDTRESRASTLLSEALTRKKVSPSTQRRNARRRAEFLKKKQSPPVQSGAPSCLSASPVPKPPKSSSTPAKVAELPPELESSKLVICEKCGEPFDLDELDFEPVKCATDCGSRHLHKQYPGDDFVWAFKAKGYGYTLFCCG